ncbi:MAG: hypothetical protein MMC33_009602, partial [Icmadophila ericetorum]|nr:hypothetical protein [Icmadophila ericetorum]
MDNPNPSSELSEFSSLPASPRNLPGQAPQSPRSPPTASSRGAVIGVQRHCLTHWDYETYLLVASGVSNVVVVVVVVDASRWRASTTSNTTTLLHEAKIDSAPKGVKQRVLAYQNHPTALLPDSQSGPEVWGSTPKWYHPRPLPRGSIARCLLREAVIWPVARTCGAHMDAVLPASGQDTSVLE